MFKEESTKNFFAGVSFFLSEQKKEFSRNVRFWRAACNQTQRSKAMGNQTGWKKVLLRKS